MNAVAESGTKNLHNPFLRCISGEEVLTVGKQRVAVWRLVNDGTEGEVCGSFGFGINKFSLVVTHIEDISKKVGLFFKTYPAWRPTGNVIISFLFTVGNNRFFVHADQSYADSGCSVCSFNYDNKLYAHFHYRHHRLVIPQLGV